MSRRAVESNFSAAQASAVAAAGVRNKRRSRLGTRASLAFFKPDFSANDFQPPVSEKEVVGSQRKQKPAPLPFSYSPALSDATGSQNGIKKRLFTRSPISRRLNMDSSSLSSPADDGAPVVTRFSSRSNNNDPDVTGVCYFKETSQLHQLSKKDHASQQNNAKYMSTTLGATRAKSPAPKFHYDAKVTLPNNKFTLPQPKTPTAAYRFKRVIVKTPTPPVQRRLLLNNRYTIKTPESPKLTHIQANKQHASTSGINNDVKSRTSSNEMMKTENNIVMNRKSTNNLITSTQQQVSDMNHVESLLKNDDELSTGVILYDKRTDSLMSYELDNSLEAAYVKSTNGTYIVSTNNNEPLKNESKSNDMNTVINNIDVKESVTLQSNKTSPDFLIHNKKSNFELDESTETFVYNESMLEQSESNIAVKEKPKLSMITEEVIVSTVVPLQNKSNKIENSSNEINDSVIDLPSSANKTLVESHNKTILQNFSNNNLIVCDIVKYIEKQQKETVLFLNKFDSSINQIKTTLNELKLQREQFILNHNENVVGILNALKNEITISNNNNKENQTDAEVNFINQLLTSSENAIKSSIITSKSKKTLSNSVYNQLKNDYGCLKTPKPTVTKNAANQSKILTPHSMSMCIQDQVDLLFDS